MGGAVARLDQRVDLLGRRLVRRRMTGRVRHDEVDAAETRLHHRGERVDRGGVGHVQYVSLDRGAALTDLGDGSGDPLGVAAGEQHDVAWLHAFGESFDDSTTEPGVRPGDDRNAS